MDQSPSSYTKRQLMNLKTIIININLVSNASEVQQAAQPVMIFPGIIWNPIGKSCEIENCGSEAYKICDEKIYNLWRGCGKAYCISHANIDIKKRKDRPEKYAGSHCKGEPCQSQRSKAHYKIFSIVFCTVVILLVAF